MYVDFQRIKSEIAVEQVADMLELDLAAEDNQWRGKCPRCKNGGERALVVTPGKGYYCFADKKGGDCIALAAHILTLSMKDAALRITEYFELLSETKEPEEQGTEEAPRTLEPLSYLLFDHEAVQALGLDPRLAETLGVGYAKKGIMRGRVAVPVRLPNGTLAGYIGYSPEVEPRIKLPPHFFVE